MRRALLAALLAALLLPGAGQAGVRLSGLDTSGYPSLRLTVVTSKPVARPPTLRENGHRVPDVVARSLGTGKALVLAVDTSRSMTGQPLEDAVAAAKVFLQQKREDDNVALVTFSSHERQLTGFSTDARSAGDALDQLAASSEPGTALYETVTQASRALSKDQLLNRVLVVITDGRDVSPQGSLSNAISSARDAGVAVYTIGIGSSAQEPLRRLAETTGGAYSQAASSAALTGIAGQVARQFARTWQLTYATRTPPGDRLRLAVSQPGAGTTARTFLIPATAGEPAPESGVSHFFLHTTLGNLLAALAIGALLSLGAMAWLSARDVGRVRKRLNPHVPTRERHEEEHSSRRFSALNGFFSATERSIGRFGMWGKLRHAIERADSTLRPSELFWIMAGSGLLLGLVVVLIGAPPFLAVLVVPIGGVVPYLVLQYKGGQRQKAFDEQLADVLMTIAASVRVGHTFRQSMQAVVKESQEPASKEFKRVLLETDLGRPPDEALSDMATRLGSSNFEYVVSVVSIQREVGGSLAALFDMVSETVRQRQQFAKKMRGLTAMGRVSAYVLIILPFALVAGLSIINYTYMKPLFTTATGRFLIVIALCGMAIGSLILKKIVSFRMA